MGSLDELGQQVLERIAEIWHIDSGIRWIKSEENEAPGFDRWPGDFRVSVRVSVPEPKDADGQLKVVVSTDFLKDVAIESDRFAEWVAATGAYTTSTYGLVYPSLDTGGPTPASRSLRLSSTAYVTRETFASMPDLLAHCALIQPINAQLYASMMSEVLGSGKPDTSRPADLSHLEFDEMLDVVANVYVPHGRGPNRWSGTGEFEAFAEQFGRSDRCFGSADHAGMSLETPFGSERAFIHFLTDEEHPQLGHGLTAVLRLPFVGTSHAIAKEVAALNLLEAVSWTGFPQLGCWHAIDVRPGEKAPAFTLFVPNVLYRPGLITHFAMWFVLRARWAREQRYPDMQDLPLADIPKRLAAIFGEGADTGRSGKERPLLTRLLDRFRPRLDR
jgi:hypothetical protein